MCRRAILSTSIFLLLYVTAGSARAVLVAYWPMDEGSGTTVADMTGAWDGTITGNVTWIDGHQGTALDFPGGNNFVNFGNVEIGPSMTLSYWCFNPEKTFERPLGQQAGNYSTVPGWAVYSRDEGEGGVWFRVHGADDAWNGGDIIIADNLPKDEWYHLAFTFDGETRELKGYYNGDLKAEKICEAGRAIYPSASDLRLGNTGAGGAYTGALDEVAIWDHVMTDKEVLAVLTLGPLVLDPKLAGEPNPEDEATDMPRDTVLSWTPGLFAQAVNGHIVYFSESLDDVSNGIGGVAQSAASYTPPQRLDFGKTYYWRVDEVNAPPDSTVHEGSVWSFKTEPVGYPIAGENITATASSSNNADTVPGNTINGTDSGLDENDLHTDDDKDMWLSNMDGPEPTWIQYEFDKVYKLHEMWVWNHNTSLEPVVGFGTREAVIEYSTDGTNWTTLGTTHEFNQAPGTPGYAHNTTVDLNGVSAKHVKITANSNWNLGGWISQYGLSEVRFFYIPVWARTPGPASSAQDVGVDSTLAWRAGREADRHDVYLSADEQAVIDGTADVVTVTEPGHAPSLDLASTYYWRVDEANDVETPTIWQGDIWNFTTQESIVVDDFESYNEIYPGEEGSNRIFEAWIDGFQVPTNGALVGYDAPLPSMESDIVHSGSQSVPMAYDNTAAAMSEITRTLAAQNWTDHGIQTLSLWFYGNATNKPGQLYVKINGVQVDYDGEASDLTLAAWQPWNIDLTSVGADLSSVTSLAIGIQAPGATGTLLLDDIRLYSHGRQLVTPVEPDPAGLAAHWQLDGTFNDSSGNSRHGAASGGPTFVPGKTGQAVSLDGLDDYVEVSNLASLSFETDFTWSAWIKTSSDGTVLCLAPATGDWAQGGKSLFVRNGLLTVDVGWVGALASTMTVNDDRWHHVAMTTRFETDGTNDTTTLYIDGQAVASRNNWNMNAHAETGLIVKIGFTNGNFPANPWFNGLIDEVRIYSGVLTSEELAWLAGRTQPFDKPF
jgi:hypothetical protein